MTRQCGMVWPIFWGESYVGETGESMEVVDLAASRKDKCRNIAIALIDRIVSVMVWFRQLSHQGTSKGRPKPPSLDISTPSTRLCAAVTGR